MANDKEVILSTRSNSTKHRQNFLMWTWICTQFVIMEDSAERRALFVQPESGRNLKRPAIATRVMRLIEEYSVGSFPNCHDLRKQTPPMGCYRGLDQGDAAQAVFWSSNNWFIKTLFVSNFEA